MERFHCFGCGRQGDVLDFVREVKGVDLPEAIRILGGGVSSRPNLRPKPVKARDPYEGVTPIRPPADLLTGRPARAALQSQAQGRALRMGLIRALDGVSLSQCRRLSIRLCAAP